MTLDDSRQATKVIIFALVVLIVVYDAVMVWLWGREATVSVVVNDAARDAPIIGVAIGVLIGHLFWSLR